MKTMHSFLKVIPAAVLGGLFASLLHVPSAQAEKLALDWFVNPDHASIITGLVRGSFAEAGIELEIIEPADPNDPPRWVAAGDVDIALSYQPNLHLQIDRGLPIAWVGTLVATPLNSLVVLDDGPIGKIEDLKGKKIGFSVGGFEDAILAQMLENHGLTLDQIELINVNWSLSSSLLGRQVDAVIGAFRNFELHQLRISGSKGIAFYPEEHGVPAYDELIFITRRDRVNDPFVAKFFRVLEQEIIWIINHPQEAKTTFTSYRAGLDDELNDNAFDTTWTRFARRPRAIDRARYENFSRFLVERALIHTPQTWEDISGR